MASTHSATTAPVEPLPPPEDSDESLEGERLVSY